MSTHHVCGIHETESGLNRCHHEDKEPAEHPAYLTYGSPAHSAMKQVILGAKLRQKIPFIARYRHTGLVESFHSLSLVYTPKHVFFWPPMFASRKRMAVIDFNANHGLREELTEGDGRKKLEMVYSRAKGSMKMRRVVAAKTHPYVAGLLADMLERRRAGPVLGPRPLSDDDPRQISRYIHKVVRPTTQEQQEMRLEWEGHQRRRSENQ
ncbi:hypothetical protein FJT64_020852 [Amphibalanus amphitrite]|uniref:Uncharacterized protein n=1 Tax=Amphibalanus amphitrite TaxID=1232801 RepID=A0A6A4WKB9_AMPAM|nr:hypothetical protein FJT64_020852 [Amphibalanus amphitrite]